MPHPDSRPRVFVGSSVESLPLAYAVQQNLEFAAEVTIWNQGVFQPSRYVLEELGTAVNSFDFGVFIFSPDDITTIRDQEYRSVRDNVVFEIGLFIGALGRERTYIVAPHGIADLRLPSDLLGLTMASFDAARRDGNLRAALGPACHEISRLTEAGGIRGDRTQKPPRTVPLGPEQLSKGANGITFAAPTGELSSENREFAENPGPSKGEVFARLRESLAAPLWEEILDSDDLPAEVVERLFGSRLVYDRDALHIVLPNRSTLFSDSAARRKVERVLRKRVTTATRVTFRTEKAQTPTAETLGAAWSSIITEGHAPAGAYAFVRDAQIQVFGGDTFLIVLSPNVPASIAEALKSSDFRSRSEARLSEKLRWSVSIRVVS